MALKSDGVRFGVPSGRHGDLPPPPVCSCTRNAHSRTFASQMSHKMPHRGQATTHREPIGGTHVSH